ncbi:MAG: T9SS type A sorting domain-containing protein [candidate division KSB1 bacterium]|nr:T9SS type A sorting domain-containing protein [candidate division KSB1 bacterium]MDZ7300763.1 T9SS type A sorting domain-containing protein [candidate division KSB1 bacterium]
MKYLVALLVTSYVLFIALAVKSPHKVAAQPSFNGTGTPGCAGSGCHAFKRGIITAQSIGNKKIRITLSGTTSKVAADVVDRSGVVATYVNSTSSNPFEVTVSQTGIYKIYGGYKNPNLSWDSISVRVNATTSVEQEAPIEMPNGFHLAQNYPNPFFAGASLSAKHAALTNISYSLPRATSVSVVVYDLAGREIKRLVDGAQNAGAHHVQWDGRDAAGNRVAAGTYFYRLQADKFSTARKLMLLE